MVALTIMYSILFFIIRRQTRKMPTTNSSSDFYKSQGTASETGTTNEVDSWPTHLGAAKSSTGANQIVVTTSVRVTDAERSNPMANQWKKNRSNENAKKRMNNVSTTLLCYPIAYLCLIMPVTAARIAEFTGAPVPLPVVFFACGFYASTGYVNVILYTVTRKGIVDWTWLPRLLRRDRNNASSDNTLQLNNMGSAVGQNLSFSLSSSKLSRKSEPTDNSDHFTLINESDLEVLFERS
jgi:hypothetical protein